MNTNYRILVVDDEEDLCDILKFNLENEGYEVETANSAEEALKMDLTKFHLLLLDVMMGEISGFKMAKMLKQVRETRDIPIIFLTARDTENDAVTGFTLGADDYITKPFLPLELVARVKAQLRRYKRYNRPEAENEKDIIIHSGLVLNIKTHECTLNEKPLSLTPTEFSILQILCQNIGNVVSAEELFHRIWKDEYFSKSNNTITVHIRHLREKMDDSFEKPKYIKTVWRCGYKIEK